jgi:TRAP-type mannitol/chloroaromatic compound transport system permease small subunit
MTALLALARGIDKLNDKFAWLAIWAILLSCLISALNTVVRYAFSYSSNGFLEIQWYLFTVAVMFGAAQVLRVNEHVRVDVLYNMYGGRGQAIFDAVLTVVFLMGSVSILLYFTWPLFTKMYVTNEMSSNAGGLIRWPFMLMFPVGYVLLLLQGASEVIKRVGWLTHRYEGDFHYERPLQ